MRTGRGPTRRQLPLQGQHSPSASQEGRVHWFTCGQASADSATAVGSSGCSDDHVTLPGWCGRPTSQTIPQQCAIPHLGCTAGSVKLAARGSRGGLLTLSFSCSLSSCKVGPGVPSAAGRGPAQMPPAPGPQAYRTRANPACPSRRIPDPCPLPTSTFLPMALFQCLRERSAFRNREAVKAQTGLLGA